MGDALGLGDKSGIDLPNEVEGIMPSTAWKKARTGEKWYAGETISVAIGQGQVSVTPISMAVMMADRGQRRHARDVPHLVRAVDDGRRVEAGAGAARRKSVVTLKPETVRALHDGLWMVVNGAGTGGRARIAGRDVAGKTGTAQVISLQGGSAARAGPTWTCATTAGSCSSRRATTRRSPASSSPSTPSTATWRRRSRRHIIETYFAKKEGRPLPVFVPPAARSGDGRRDDGRRTVTACSGQQAAGSCVTPQVGPSVMRATGRRRQLPAAS